MKTLQKGIFYLTGLYILMFIACQEKQKKEGPDKESDHETAKRPEGIISLNEAKTLCTNYEDRRITAIKDFERSQNNAQEAFVPTQFIGFDLKTLKKYIKYVERKSRRANVEPDSIRIYLGNYGPNGEDKNKNTVFMLPTAKVNGEYGGFFINTNGEATLIRNHWPDDKNPDQISNERSEAGIFPSLHMPYQQESLILNHGHGGPPPTGDF